MSTSRCPLCTKRFTIAFLPLHAASCTPTIRKPLRKKQKRPRPPLLHPRHATRLPLDAPPSETAAPGFHVFLHAFTSVEQTLLREIESAPPAWSDYRFRRTKNYGPAYNLAARRFLFGPRAPAFVPLPSYATDIVLPRLCQLTDLLGRFDPNQMTVGLYQGVGSHILPHNDCENGSIGTAVVGVCLGAECTMTLILRARESGVGRDVKRDVVLPRGACYVMSGDALRVWEHAIFPRKTKGRRVSLTFRDVAPHPGEIGDSVKEGIAGRNGEEKKRRFIQSSLQ